MSSQEPPVTNNRLQFSLWTLLLVATAIAAWVAYFQAQSEQSRLLLELTAIRHVARVVIVTDPSQFAAVRQHAANPDDFRWRVYLPSGKQYRLCWSTVNSANIYMSPAISVVTSSGEVQPGKHEVHIRWQKVADKWIVQGVVDGQVVASETKPAAWNPQEGKSVYLHSDKNRQQTTAEQLNLISINFKPAEKTGAEPASSENGLRVWIEPVKP